MQANVTVDPRRKYLKTHLECLEMMNIHPSDSLELFCILLKLYTTKFQSKRNSLGCVQLEQENLAQKPGMKMLTHGCLGAPAGGWWQQIVGWDEVLLGIKGVFLCFRQLSVFRLY